MTSDFDVAVHALVFLSHSGHQVSSEALAENICTNAVRVRRVMSKLKKVGLVSSAEGAEGGYLIARDARDITLAQVAGAIGGAIVSSHWRSGDIDKECLISSGMGAVMEDLYDDMDRQCRALLAKRTIADIEHSLLAQQPAQEHAS